MKKKKCCDPVRLGNAGLSKIRQVSPLQTFQSPWFGFCIMPFQEGFPNLQRHRTLISCTIWGLVFHKTHIGKP